jgi:phage gp37-like protein
MPSEFKPAELVAAVVAKVLAGLAGAAEVQQLAANHFNENGDIIVKPPAALVLWTGELPTVNKDNTRTSYQSVQSFEIWCADTNLRSMAEESTDSLKIVALVRAQIAGARFTLADTTKTQPAVLGETGILQIDKNGTWYATKFAVPHSAQFAGVNA